MIKLKACQWTRPVDFHRKCSSPHPLPITYPAELLAVQQHPRQLPQRLLHPPHKLHGQQSLRAVQIHGLGYNLAGLQPEATRSQQRGVPAHRHHRVQELAHRIHQHRPGIPIRAEPQRLQASVLPFGSVEGTEGLEEQHMRNHGGPNGTSTMTGGNWRNGGGCDGSQEFRSL